VAADGTVISSRPTVALCGCGFARGMRGGCSEVSMARSGDGAFGCALLRVKAAGMVVSVV
jgi:hypothetical protein